MKTCNISCPQVTRTNTVLPGDGSGLSWDLSSFNPNVTADEGTQVKWVVALRTSFGEEEEEPVIFWLGPNGKTLNRPVNGAAAIEGLENVSDIKMQHLDHHLMGDCYI